MSQHTQGGRDMAPRYRIALTDEERQELEQLTRPGKTESRKYIHARVLLLCDTGAGGPAWHVCNVAESLGISSRTVEKLKRRFVEEGFNAALERKVREKPPREIQFDGAFEARLLALACSPAPDGRARWTLRLLADKAVELNFVPSVSHMTVQRILKKANLNLTCGNIGKYLLKRTRPL
jgi:transposase